MATTPSRTREEAVHVGAGAVVLDGNLAIPERAIGIVLFAHGSGSSRHSTRNRYVAGQLQEARIATLLFDLLTLQEEADDARTGHLRFDLDLLAERLVLATGWLEARPETAGLPIGYFGASTGAGAALIAAAKNPERVRAMVSRGGRPDLAGSALPEVRCPTLLIVGGDDVPVIGLNRQAMARMTAPVKLEVVPGATHLFEEPGKLGIVAHLARDWFQRYLGVAMPG